MKFNTIRPILRIFDYTKAIEFYVDWLGFKIDWEHRFEENTPIYMQISLDEIKLHLSEHHGDSSPGIHLHVNCVGIKEFHQLLIEKKYKYNRPGLEETFYDTWSVTVSDPFSNKITFDEEIREPEKPESP